MAIRYLSGINVDSNTLFVDSTNNRVGIGTASPSTALDVIGTVTAYRYQAISSSASLVGYGVGTGLGMFNAGTDTLGFATASTERLRITSTGNVGIGTTAPTYKLDVVGEGRTSDAFMAGGAINIDNNLAIQISSAGAGTQRWIGINKNNGYGLIIGYVENAAALSGVGAYIRQVTSDPIHFLVNNATTAMSIVNSGNVGIGTTSPSTRLQVDKASQTIGGTTPNGALVVSSLAAGNGILEIGVDPTSLAYIQSRNVASNTVYQLLLNPDGGNVGIGTTSPSAKLEVNVGLNSLKISGRNTYVDSSEDATNANIYVTQDGVGDFGQLAGNLVLQARTQGTVYRDIIFAGGLSNGDALMTILGEGNVGIGTTSPSQLLHVNGTSQLLGANFGIAGNNDFANYAIKGDAGGSVLIYNWYSGHIFQTNGGEERMRITNAGNVGIGTTSPAYKLDVSGDIRSTTINLNTQGVNVSSYGFLSQTLSGQMTFLGHNVRASSTVNNTAVVVNGGWISSLIKQYYSEGITFHTSTTEYSAGATYPLADTERMRITSAGNVGIGTTSPNARLTVVGDDSSNPNVALRLSSTGYAGVPYPNTSLRFGSAYSSYPSWNLASIDAGYTGASWGGSLLFYTNNDSDETNLTERMRITAGGNVGIGTTAPANTLQIGSVGATGYGGNRLALGDGTNVVVLHPGAVSYLTANGDIVVGAGGNTTNQLYVKSGGNVGIGTTSPSQALHVSGSARVTGAYYDSSNSAGSSGQVLSSTGSGTAWVNQGEATATSLYDLLPAARTTYAWTVQLTAGTWADIFSSNTVLSNGTWMVQAFVNDYAVGGQQYSETYSGVMSWGEASSTNQGGPQAISEIVLHRSGHAANSGNFYLRTVERVTSTLLFQGMSNQTYSAASTINFKFVKIF